MTNPPHTSWKVLLQEKINPEWSEEIDVFERQMELRKLGKISEPVFARRGEAWRLRTTLRQW